MVVDGSRPLLLFFSRRRQQIELFSGDGYGYRRLGDIKSVEGQGRETATQQDSTYLLPGGTTARVGELLNFTAETRWRGVLLGLDGLLPNSSMAATRIGSLTPVAARQESQKAATRLHGRSAPNSSDEAVMTGSPSLVAKQQTERWE